MFVVLIFYIPYNTNCILLKYKYNAFFYMIHIVDHFVAKFQKLIFAKIFNCPMIFRVLNKNFKNLLWLQYY